MDKSEFDEVSKEIVKRGRPKGSTDLQPRKSRTDYLGNEAMTEQVTSLYIKHCRLSTEMPDIDITDPKQIKERMEWYINLCENDGIKPTVSGMCNALGISRKTLYRWEQGEYRKDTHQYIVVKYKKFLEELWETQMVEGKINPITGIFIGKNHFGYTDKQEIELAPKNPLGDTQNTAEVEQRYIESVAEDFD